MRGEAGAPVAGILLAAGFGRRFGGDKLLHPLADGTPLAVASARVLKSACPRAVAVLRPAQRELARLLAAEGLAVVVCPEAEGGMGHSLAAGVAACADAAGWVVALADMPFIRVSTVAAVAAALAGGARIAAPACQGRRGHPVGFAASWREALCTLTGDAGARVIVGRHAAQLQVIDTDDAGVLRDVDTQADLMPG